MGEGWVAFSDDSHLSSILSPSFIPLAWAKDGLSLTTPIFRPSFSHPSYLLDGRRVGFAYLLPPFARLSPSFIPLAWVKGGLSLTTPIFRPSFSHPSYLLHGRR